MTNYNRLSALLTVAVLVCVLGCRPAAAEGFSPNEGFTADGAYKWAFELDPFGFLPHIHASVAGLGPRGAGGGSGSVSASQLVQSLQGAFFGTGIVRYGPWLAELNVDYVDVAQNKSLYVVPLGRNAGAHVSLTMVVVQAGAGIEVIRSQVASVPVSLDLRAGLQYLYWDPGITTDANLFGGAGKSAEDAAPYLGVRANVYPTEKWRAQFVGTFGGLGVNDGSVNWQTTLQVSYLVTDWFDVSFGMSAIGANLIRQRPAPLGLITDRHQSAHAIAYGPVLGVGFRF